MATQTVPTADLSVDFLTWINTELRRRIEEPDDENDEADQAGLVKRLRAYLSGSLSRAS